MVWSPSLGDRLESIWRGRGYWEHLGLAFPLSADPHLLCTYPMLSSFLIMHNTMLLIITIHPCPVVTSQLGGPWLLRFLFSRCDFRCMHVWARGRVDAESAHSQHRTRCSRGPASNGGMPGARLLGCWYGTVRQR